MNASVDTAGGMQRMTLPSPIWTGRHEVGTGIWVTAIHVGPRSKRVVIETDSAWQDRIGCRTGTRYHEADANETASLAVWCEELAEAHDAIVPPTEL